MAYKILCDGIGLKKGRCDNNARWGVRFKPAQVSEIIRKRRLCSECFDSHWTSEGLTKKHYVTNIIDKICMYKVRKEVSERIARRLKFGGV